jgi:ABC-type lipoprotein release transport system permease subunit
VVLLLSTLRSLRAHALRFGLTSLGITWGALVLTYLTSTMQGFDMYFTKELEEAGPKIVLVWPGAVLKNRVGERGARSVELENEDDVSTSHCEFTAAYASTGRQFSVEAKRRQSGGEPGRVSNQLYKALKKRAEYLLPGLRRHTPTLLRRASGFPDQVLTCGVRDGVRIPRGHLRA